MTRVLKPGLSGPDVTRWQIFLRGQGYAVQATGEFDLDTSAATVKFQRTNGLSVDGKVGNVSYGKALALGFDLVDFTAEPESGYPLPPDFPSLTGTAARQARFGPLAFAAAPTPANPEKITITNGWDVANIVRRDIRRMS